jgi:hypothetical protein
MNDRTRDDYDLNQLLHRAQAFGRPSKVVNDQDPDAQREAHHSRACTVEASPDLRSKSGGPPVLFDDIMEALRTLDASDAQDAQANGPIAVACCGAIPEIARIAAALLRDKFENIGAQMVREVAQAYVRSSRGEALAGYLGPPLLSSLQ